MTAQPQTPWPAPSGPPAGDTVEASTAAAGRAEPSVSESSTSGPAVRRWATIGGLGAGLLGGVTAGLVLGVPGLSGADAPAAGAPIPAQADERSPADDDVDDGDTEDGETSDADPGAGATEDAETGDGVADEAEREAAAAERIRENLQELVDDGMLDAAQADAVAEHLAGELPVRPGGGRGAIAEHVIERREGRGDRIRERLTVGTERMDEIAAVLGLERDDLVDRVLDGESLAEIAEAEGVATQELVDILIADRLERIDQALADGEIDADEAAERRAAIEEMATTHLEGGHPAGRLGRWEPRATDDGTD